MEFIRKSWYPKVLSWIPLDLWHKLLEIDLVLPYYHIISDQDIPHVSGLYKFRSISQFKADMEFFLRFYTPVSLQDVISYLDGVRKLPKRCFLLTFDDGFREIYDIVAPILQSQGMPAVFFLITAAVDNHKLCSPQKKSLLIRAVALHGDSSTMNEASRILTNAGVEGQDLSSRIRGVTYRQRYVLDELEPVLGCDFAAYVSSMQPYLTSEQVTDLILKGFAIGAHSIDHPLYSELSVEEQLIQTKGSLSILSNRYRYECQAFAFPYSDIGITLDFYQSVFADGRLKVTFGTGGMFPHFFPRNLARFTMERTDLAASHIVARQYGRTFFIGH
ncbi:MAG: hypothetical protein A2W05_00355 [Candidatus Schekmanbacteria bacterium RBG_16_38_10]|uniref:NodB homology domain-containing protein n=1 Tax=Candidatus Schekmanbacteria bacterium RBG_16_38_10 TaxID=1817879 RepID=A0A1F7RPE6_9BACT|nr:MAG: hypothetical protein A2W05_00355 [Candidatus Schekmanbacteria bacterium RBG_16_38_10]